MIGGGGKDCQNAHHGIGITEADQASFLEAKQLEHDFATTRGIIQQSLRPTL